MAAAKIRWSELDEDDGGDGDGLDFLLPPPVVVGPDENGLKKTTHYRFDDDGSKVKVATTTRVVKLARTRLCKSAVERRSWAKFGDAAAGDDASARLTVVSTEDIFLERPRAPGSKADEPSASSDELATANRGTALMVCRSCGKKGDHWTAKCPYKELVDTLDRPPTSDGPAALNDPAKVSYVHPRRRTDAVYHDGGHDMRRRNDENSVRVTNLSEDTREPDLLELFRSFGPVSRVYVALDQRTGSSRGFGFVNFVQREDAENAISKLNGYGYDNLILHVEWATPRPSN
ncbi:Eukaryotic translation initiation factor 3 subunit G [Hordeum vulgare]|nr:Eukaryotic translation initiation factor 3 subunit G [Hordeum vulgare]